MCNSAESQPVVVSSMQHQTGGSHAAADESQPIAQHHQKDSSCTSQVQAAFCL